MFKIVLSTEEALGKWKKRARARKVLREIVKRNPLAFVSRKGGAEDTFDMDISPKNYHYMPTMWMSPDRSAAEVATQPHPNTMSCIVWNARGLGNLGVRELHRLVKEKNPSILFLSEMKVGEGKSHRWRESENPTDTDVWRATDFIQPNVSVDHNNYLSMPFSADEVKKQSSNWPRESTRTRRNAGHLLS
ncbi:hypothetical protein DH2020_045840 [Rehmannia glutinosa]|uniref:Endonuclease/exonuclease/phosphatase domain-containing protein n=1 Tax=Rehmannia glutinosa TaxID=99300 RepID=A0ABR0UDZ9_REHGL